MASKTGSKKNNTPALKPHEMVYLPIEKIHADETNFRRNCKSSGIIELSASILQNGLLHPLLVRPFGSDDHYMIVSGHRRYMAATKAGLKRLPCIIREIDEDQAKEIQIVENLQREDIDPMDECQGFHYLMKKHNLEYIASKIGKSHAFVWNRLQLSKLIPEAQVMLSNGNLPLGHAQVLSAYDESKQREILSDISDEYFDEEYRERESWQDRLLNVMVTTSLADLKKMISRRWKNISQAEFDLHDENLIEGISSCTNCPKRTCNQNLLFAEISTDDLCTDADCYQNKVLQHRENLLNEAMKLNPGAKEGRICSWDSTKVQVNDGNFTFQKKKQKGFMPVVISTGHENFQVGSVVYIPLVTESKPESQDSPTPSTTKKIQKQPASLEIDYSSFIEKLKKINFVKNRHQLSRLIFSELLSQQSESRLTIVASHFGIDFKKQRDEALDLSEKSEINDALISELIDKKSYCELLTIFLISDSLDDIPDWLDGKYESDEDPGYRHRMDVNRFMAALQINQDQFREI